MCIGAASVFPRLVCLQSECASVCSPPNRSLGLSQPTCAKRVRIPRVIKLRLASKGSRMAKASLGRCVCMCSSRNGANA
eukprot:6190358-Pleurochrysis_carterae.AAC.5